MIGTTLEVTDGKCKIESDFDCKESFEALIEFLAIIKKDEVVTIETSTKYEDFVIEFGKYIMAKYEMFTDSVPDEMLSMLGKMELDNLIPSTYFVKSTSDETVYKILKEDYDIGN